SRLHAADRALRPRPHGRRRQPAVRHYGADRLDAEAVLSANATNAALRDQELAAHAGCESRTAAPRSSLPISGLQAPQFVPAFRRWPTSSTLAAPFLISADIWCCPTPKHEQTIGPTSWPASSGCPVSSDIRAFDDNACSA